MPKIKQINYLLCLKKWMLAGHQDTAIDSRGILALDAKNAQKLSCELKIFDL